MNPNFPANSTNWNPQRHAFPSERFPQPNNFVRAPPWPPRPFMDYQGSTEKCQNMGQSSFNGNQFMYQNFGPPRMGMGPPQMAWNWNGPPGFGPNRMPPRPFFNEQRFGQNFRPPTDSIGNQRIAFPASKASKTMGTEKSPDASLVQNFLSSIGKLPTKNKPSTPTTSPGTNMSLKICEAQKMLSRADQLLKLLEATIDSSSEETENAKTELSSLLSVMNDPNVVESLKKKISLRRKSRMRRKMKRKHAYEEKLEERRRIEEKNRKIAEWQKRENKKLDQQLREAEMQKQIDEALVEVRKEQNASAKALEMISFLAKLRKIRFNARKLRGEDVPDDAVNEQFNNTVTRVKSSLFAHKTACEEKAASLKLFMEGEQEKAKLEIERKRQKKEASKRREWEKEREFILFGKSVKIDAFDPMWPVQQLHEQGNSSLHNLTQYRRMWDQYLNPSGSTIPVDWVEPENPSSEEWKEFLSPSNLDEENPNKP